MYCYCISLTLSVHETIVCELYIINLEMIENCHRTKGFKKDIMINAFCSKGEAKY